MFMTCKQNMVMTESDAKILREEIKRLKGLVFSLENQFAWLRKKVFGSMSENHLPLNPDNHQLNLFPEQMRKQYLRKRLPWSNKT